MNTPSADSHPLLPLDGGDDVVGQGGGDDDVNILCAVFLPLLLPGGGDDVVGQGGDDDDVTILC